MIGARNVIKGKIKEIKKGTVNRIIISSNCSMESIEEFGIKEGEKAVAIFKAMNVLLMA